MGDQYGSSSKIKNRIAIWSSNSTSGYILKRVESKISERDFPGGTVVKNPPANAGDMGSSPGPGRSHMPQSN